MNERVEVPGFLLLEDGTLFRGVVHGTADVTVAEVVFTTNMSGYQEVFTDPSYRGQIVVMTAPMIGNYGVNPADPESTQPQVAGDALWHQQSAARRQQPRIQQRMGGAGPG